MKIFTEKFEYDVTNIRKISIDNKMAPLSIANSEAGKLSVELEIALPDNFSNASLDSFVSYGVENSKFKLDLENLTAITGGAFQLTQSQVRVLIPQGLELKVDTDNLPLRLLGLTNKISADNENAAIILDSCVGDLKLENENGPIKLTNCRGNLTIDQENGPILAEEISGDMLRVSSENGAIKMRLAQFTDLSVKNENGLIYYESMPMDYGLMRFKNENGKIALVLPKEMGYAIEAESKLGRVRSSLKAEQQRMGRKHLFTNGDQRVKIEVKTQNSSIRLGSDPSINLGAFKSKLDDLREAIKNATSIEDNEKVQQILNKTVESLNTIKDKVTETKINEAIQNSINSLKDTIAGVNWIETKDKVLSTIEKIGTDINSNLRKFFEKVRQSDGEGDAQSGFGKHFEDLGDQLQNLWNKRPNWFSSGGDVDDELPRDVSEQSRRKILEMLENGKITADEAERLLHAIGKE